MRNVLKKLFRRHESVKPAKLTQYSINGSGQHRKEYNWTLLQMKGVVQGHTRYTEF